MSFERIAFGLQWISSGVSLAVEWTPFGFPVVFNGIPLISLSFSMDFQWVSMGLQWFSMDFHWCSFGSQWISFDVQCASFGSQWMCFVFPLIFNGCRRDL